MENEKSDQPKTKNAFRLFHDAMRQLSKPRMVRFSGRFNRSTRTEELKEERLIKSKDESLYKREIRKPFVKAIVPGTVKGKKAIRAAKREKVKALKAAQAI